MTLLFWAAMIGFGVGGFWWALRHNRKRSAAWHEFAAARQLAYANGQIAGVVSGFTVAMLRETRGRGDDSSEVTVVRCGLNGALPDDFRLERETLGDKLLQMVSRQDHQLGHPEMDSTFLLERVGEEARRVLADRTAQDRLLAMVKRYPGMRIAKGVLQLETSSSLASEQELAVMLGDAVSVATALSRARQKMG